MNKNIGSIFEKKASNIVPGEIVIKLAESSITQMSSSIPTGTSRGTTSVGAATSFGIKKLDKILAKMGVTSITRLHPPKDASRGGRGTMSLTQSMSSTFRIRLSADTDVEAEAKKISKTTGIEYTEPVYYRETYITPDDPDYSRQWGLEKIRCPEAWDRTTGSDDIIVAVIDTGVDLNHPDLAPLLVQGRDLVDLGPNPTPPTGYRFEGDFDNRDSVPQDEVGHGTHVAGTISCLSDNSVGVAGVTWECKIMPVKVLTRIVRISDSYVSGTGSSADVAAGIRWAVDHGARVLNLSLGSSSSSMVEQDAIAYAVSQGAVVVAAMGNAYTEGNPTSYPAAYPNVISVGAIKQDDERAYFSQTGSHIDVVAPGYDIFSTTWDNGYSSKSGTSMATPHVAGVAALMLSCKASLTATQVGDILRQTAHPLRTEEDDPVPNDDFGFGLIDAKAAVDRACPRKPRITNPIKGCLRPTLTFQKCQPSVLTLCQITKSLKGCQISKSIRCPTNPALCRTKISQCASVFVRCPSIQTICQTSRLTCRQTGPICGGIRPPIGGFSEEEMMSEGMSAYDPYGYDDEMWDGFDPYSPWYDND